MAGLESSGCDPCAQMVALVSDALDALSEMDQGCEVRALLLLKQAAALDKQVPNKTWEAKAGLHTAFAEVYTWIGDQKDLEQAQAKTRRGLAGSLGELVYELEAENRMLRLEAEQRDPSSVSFDTSSDADTSGASVFQKLVSDGAATEREEAFNTCAFGSFKGGSRKRSYILSRSFRPELGGRIFRRSLETGMPMSAPVENRFSTLKDVQKLAPYQKARWWYEKAKQELAKAYEIHTESRADANPGDPRAFLSILIRLGDLFGRLGQDESAAACYVAASGQSKQLSSAEEARDVREEILQAAQNLTAKCGRAVLASFTDGEENLAGLKARALLCMREGRYRTAELTYLRLLELMRDQKLADADTLLLAKVMLQAILRGHSLRPFLHASEDDRHLQVAE